MLSLILAMIAQTQPQAAAAQPPAQEARATLEGCVMENNRWVCRYAMPALEIVPTIDSGSAQVYTNATVVPPAAAAQPSPSAVADAGAAATDARVDPGVLNEREQRLVLRCAEAGWMSLCTGAERREARALRDQSTAYQAVRLQVTGMLGRNQCDAAVRTALETGNLALAREARDFCAGQAGAAAASTARSTPPD